MRLFLLAALAVALLAVLAGPGTAAADPVVAAAGDISCDPGHASFNGGLGTFTLITDPTQPLRDRRGRLLAYVKRFRRQQRGARHGRRGAWRVCKGDFHRPA